MIGSRHELTKARTSNAGPSAHTWSGPRPRSTIECSNSTPGQLVARANPSDQLHQTVSTETVKHTTTPAELLPSTAYASVSTPAPETERRPQDRLQITHHRSILAKQEGCPSPALRLLRTTEPEESAPMANRSCVRATRVSRPHPSREPFSVGTHAELMQSPAGSFPLQMDAARRRRPESSWT